MARITVYYRLAPLTRTARRRNAAILAATGAPSVVGWLVWWRNGWNPVLPGEGNVFAFGLLLLGSGTAGFMASSFLKAGDYERVAHGTEQQNRDFIAYLDYFAMFAVTIGGGAVLMEAWRVLFG